MKNNYEKIDGCLSMNLEESVKLLLQYDAQGKKVCMEFNGVMLYSDTVTMDSAYKEVTGRTRDEHIQKQKEWREQMKREEEEHQRQIPVLTEKWIAIGRTILDKEYWKLWSVCVPIRLSDLYRGMELGNCLDIVSSLNNGCTMEEAKKIIDEQGHSVMSYGLVRSMVRSFCDRGEEFFNYTK